MERHYGWVIVAAGAVITCLAMGAMFALPVYLQPIADETGWTRAGISGAMTVGFIVMGVAGFFWGTLTDRIGARPVVLVAVVGGCHRPADHGQGHGERDSGGGAASACGSGHGSLLGVVRELGAPEPR